MYICYTNTIFVDVSCPLLKHIAPIYSRMHVIIVKQMTATESTQHYYTDLYHSHLELSIGKIDIITALLMVFRFHEILARVWYPRCYYSMVNTYLNFLITFT